MPPSLDRPDTVPAPKLRCNPARAGQCGLKARPRAMPGAGFEPASPRGQQLLRPPDFTSLSTRARRHRSRGPPESSVDFSTPQVVTRRSAPHGKRRTPAAAWRLTLWAARADDADDEGRVAEGAREADPERQVPLHATGGGDVAEVDDVAREPAERLKDLDHAPLRGPVVAADEEVRLLAEQR